MFIQHETKSARASVGVLFLGTLVAVCTFAAAYASQPVVPRSPQRPPNPGTPLLDPAIQNIAEAALKQALLQRPAEGGFVIVSDPSTGRVLAVANQRSTHDPAADLKPWSLSYLVEPASAIKTIIAAAAVESGVTELEESHDCENGRYVWDGHVYRDYMSFDHLTTAQTVIHSSNICGIKVGQKLGSAAIARALAEFGFGPGGTTQGFPGARPGRVPVPGDIPESEYIALSSTGYSVQPGFYVSPLELVQAYGAIANGGSLLRPRSTAGDGAPAQIIRRVLSEATAHQMRTTLAQAVTEGNGGGARSALYTTAGKTSTAYEPSLEPQHTMTGGEIGIAGFVGFAPADQPRVVVYVGIIRPKSPHPEGGVQAAPVFKQVAENILRYWSVAPDAAAVH